MKRKKNSSCADHNIFPMLDRRKFPRVPTRNVVSYLSTDKRGNKLNQGMGRAMDISQSGILLETTQRIDSENIILEFVDLEDNLVSIKGKVAYCNSYDRKKFKTGISFQGTHEKNIEIATKLLRIYHTRKKPS